ncbi:hypothetical protein HFC70_13765 [Agrobacterium sp. a22-2]|uniref:hypothetical protein n=1 Tax=Agrobacterium sp. a22-2 TaxID=2283840 RepID=UPI001446906E|nr:hypothetical protein [Agrobacterium sp. a22-2]NKN37420.1 hypothetical protein [Agrobacterium sp. a22-2]
MTFPPQPSLYNQYRLGDADFTANFTARHGVLDLICRRLKSIGTPSDNLHQIIIGPRGMGKTSLLRRIAIEIDQNSDLADRFIPLGFREEQYNVLTLRDFWRNCGESLAEWADAHGMQSLAERLDINIASQGWDTDEGAAEQFSEEMAALGSRAVLLVDNLDLIIEALKDHDRWALRSSLQVRGGPIVIGTATQTLRESGNRDAAFYEFFEPHYLEPLNIVETETCMRALARRRGAYGNHVLQILDTQPTRLKTLHILTGGNPRVLTLIYRLLEAAESDATMADLETLLDQVTPYYKARIEEYQSAQQRAAIDAIALNWDPVTTSELSKITTIPSTTLSPILIKLRKNGLIDSVETSGAYSGHQIVERFLNIWYLMRHGTRRTKQKMRWLVAFLTNFYSPQDLHAINQHAVECGDANRWHKDYAFAFHQAMNTSTVSVPRTVQQGHREVVDHALASTSDLDQAFEISETQELTRDLFEKAKAAALAGELYQAISFYQNVLELVDDDGSTEVAMAMAMAMVNKAYTFGQIGDHAAEIAGYHAVIGRFGEANAPELLKQVARAMFNKAVVFGRSGDRAAEIAGYDAIIGRFGDVYASELLQLLAWAMVNKAAALGQSGDHAAEIAGYDAVIGRFGEATAPELLEQVAWAMVNKADAFGQSGDRAAEIAGYDAVIGRFGEASAPELLEQVARAMVNKADAFGQSGDRAAEIAGYDAVIGRFGEATTPKLLKQVAWAMVNKAYAFSQSGDRAAEIAGYDAVIGRFGEASAPELLEQVAWAMVNKAYAFGQSGDRATEIAGYDAVIGRFGEASAPELLEQVAWAMVNKADAFRQSGDRAAEIAGYDAIIGRFGEATAPELLGQVARAMVNKAYAFGQSGDRTTEIAGYDAVIVRFGEATAPELLEHVARAMVNKAYAFVQSGDRTAEIAGYDAVIGRFGEASAPELLKHVARAMFNRAYAFGQSGDHGAEIAGYDAVIGRFGEASAPELLKQVARAMLNRAYAFGQSGDLAAEIAGYDAVIGRFGEASALELLQQVAWAMLNKAYAFGQSGDRAAEIAGYDAVIGRFGEASALELLQQVAWAMLKKADALGQSGDLAAEIAGYDAVIGRFGEAGAPELLQQVAWAMVKKAYAFGQSGDRAAEIAGYDAVIGCFGEATAPELLEQVLLATIRKASSLSKLGQSDAAVDTYELALVLARNVHTGDQRELMADVLIALGNYCLDWQGDLLRAESALLEALPSKPLLCNANLIWVKLFLGKTSEISETRNQIADLPSVGLAFIDAAIALSAENIGDALAHVEAALTGDLESGIWDFQDDQLRLLRFAEAHSYGERLIEWFDQSGFADRFAPLYAAFKAYVRGERMLLDVNPEVRLPAQEIYGRLSATKRYQQAKIGPGSGSTRRKRGEKSTETAGSGKGN